MMSKVIPLAEAIRKFVRPGMNLHFGAAWAFPSAALFEVMRQFIGCKAGFTLSLSAGGATSAAPFLAAGLARKVVSSFLGDGYPNPGPNPTIQRAINSRRVSVELWTMLTFTLRLMAGALKLPALPTRSILGSELEDDLGDRFQRVLNPFNPAETLGLLPPLHPDLNITHGWAADPEGNTILPVPLANNAFGALAAREGTIVTVEKIVDAETIRAHSFMVRIPAHVVRAVCEAPFGAHPFGCLGLGVPGGNGYREDREFILEARTASKTEADQIDWIRRWILGCPDHQAYLARLGSERLAALADLSLSSAPVIPLSPLPTPSEVMIVGAAREVEAAIRSRGFRSILAGIGASHLAAWLAESRLRADGFSVDLMAEVGTVGYKPRMGDPFLFALQNVPTASLTSDILTVLGMLVPHERARCLGVLGAAQIDKWGNLNTTRMTDGGFLMGSGGANDVASTASEVIVVATQSRHRFVERVAHVTSPGERVVTVVTQLGVYRKVGGELTLSGVFTSEAEPSKAIHDACQACSWGLKVARQVETLPLPSEDERLQMRSFDPYGDLWS